jgi:hypothetical protein
MNAQATSQRRAGSTTADTVAPLSQRKSASPPSRDFGLNLSRVPVSAAPPRRMQASLVIGKPGDAFEREADRVADSVTRSSASTERPSAAPESLRRATDDDAAHAEPAAETAVADEGPEGEEKAEHVATMLLENDDLEGGEAEAAGKPATMQASEVPGERPAMSGAQLAGFHALRGKGEPLPAASRAYFEPRFGQDLSHVRVHSGAEAGELAQGVGARAFTVGRDIVFGEGHYEPASAKGRWLMAHELTHVLQQQEGVARSVGAIPLQQSGPRVQRGLLGKIWSGVKKAASAVGGAIAKGASTVWGGIKKGAAAVGRGAKWLGGKVWKGIKAVSKWGWNVLKAGGAMVWSSIVETPGRIWRVLKHLGSGVAGVAKWLWQGLKLAWHLDFKGLGKWLVDGFLSGAAWVGRLIAKLIDVAGIGEVWDLVMQIIKFNTRTMTSTEKSEAQKTFKNSISYWQVRIDEYSLISAIGAAFKGGGGMGVTTFHTINFNQKINATAGSGDMHWLTHELTHVSQYEHVGSQYLGEAIHAQATGGYVYGGPSVLWRPTTNPSPNPTGKHFRQFNREQQGDIAADYYDTLYGTGPGTTPDYEPVIDELRAGAL